MKYHLAGIPDDQALDRLQELDEIDKVILSPLKRLDNLLEIVKKYSPKSVSEYASKLESRFESLVKKDYVKLKGIDMGKNLSELPHIKEFPVLAASALNYLLGALKLSEEDNWSDKIEVVQRDYLRSFLSSRYYNLLVLTETIDRAKAIEIYKEHFERINEKRLEESEERYQNLDELSKDTRNSETGDPGWMRIVGEVVDGTILVRKDTCLWADAMQEYPDSELKFLVCCYGDYTSIRSANKHFALTMEHSIAGGHSYCDCVIHDTRINDKLEHPSDEFFASLEQTK
ncbi:MAG: L-2-amino-thiazoline-4-carboxylic acid hydrolase [Candidatus Thorarchaeota archaeon]|jgi:hypothetical protein